MTLIDELNLKLSASAMRNLARVLVANRMPVPTPNETAEISTALRARVNALLIGADPDTLFEELEGRAAAIAIDCCCAALGLTPVVQTQTIH